MSEGKRVLVVDDEIDIGRFFYRLLNGKDLRVVLATNGKEARQALHNQEFHLALLDLKLPDVHGLQLLKEIKELQPGCEVIIMTGYGTIRTAVEAIRLGAYDFLEKPFNDISEIEHLVESVLHYSQDAAKTGALEYGWEEAALQAGFVVGSTPRMLRLVTFAHRIAGKNLNVLIQGETGTGKEVLARFIHLAGGRPRGNFVAVNCGALPENILESELFGHERGAFTGAVGQRRGFFELAHRGTLFLDEIGEASPAIQVKLLRVLETGEFYRVGGEKPVKSDVRLIAATNVDLGQAVKEKTFREDLFYRLEVVRLELPPLRERSEDISLLINFFLHKFSAAGKCSVTQVSSECLDLLSSYHWPGNVRELANCLEQAVALGEGEVLLPCHLPEKIITGGNSGSLEDLNGENNEPPAAADGPLEKLAAFMADDFSLEHLPDERILAVSRLTQTLALRLGREVHKRKLAVDRPLTLKEMECRLISEALAQNQNSISSAARSLGIARSTLYRKIKECDLI